MPDYFDVHSEVKGAIIVAGSFAPNGNSAIDNTANNPTGLFTAARTGTGVYTITLATGVNNILFSDVRLRTATAGATSIELNSYVSSTGVITVTALSGTTTTEATFTDVSDQVSGAAADLTSAVADLTSAHINLDNAGDHLVLAGADSTWDATTAAHVDDAGDSLISAGTTLSATRVHLNDVAGHLSTMATNMVTRDTAIRPVATDIAAAAGTRIEFFAVVEDSGRYKVRDV